MNLCMLPVRRWSTMQRHTRQLQASALPVCSHSTAPPNRRVAVGMSGGIDSAAAVYVLQRAGFDCVGVFMKNWDSSDEAGLTTCTYSRDLQDTKDVCCRLGVPFVEVSFAQDYWNDVFQPTLDAYESGTSTPNPDVGCNRQIKFGRLRDYALEQLGVDFLATGHYARLGRRSQAGDASIIVPSFSPAEGCSGSDFTFDFDCLLASPSGGAADAEAPVLLRGVDRLKDQSYFLSMTRGSQLRHVLFPLGGLTKKQVRALVAEPLRDLGVLTKAESMGVCFIGKRKFSDFLRGYISMRSGRFVDVDSGAVLGRHNGQQALTSGQSARIGGRDAKYFVVGNGGSGSGSGSGAGTAALQHENAAEGGLQAQEGDVLVARGSDHPALFSRSLLAAAEDFSWIDGAGPPELQLLVGNQDCANGIGGMAVTGLHCKARYGQALEACSVQRTGAHLRVDFVRPQRSLTPGQVAVLYRGDECLGGGIICAPVEVE